MNTEIEETLKSLSFHIQELDDNIFAMKTLKEKLIKLLGKNKCEHEWEFAADQSTYLEGITYSCCKEGCTEVKRVPHNSIHNLKSN